MSKYADDTDTKLCHRARNSDDITELQEDFDHVVNLWSGQPHLLNKYQINMGFSHFHEIEILSRINILSPYQIDIVIGCSFCNGNIILI